MLRAKNLKCASRLFQKKVVRLREPWQSPLTTWIHKFSHDPHGEVRNANNSTGGDTVKNGTVGQDGSTTKRQAESSQNEASTYNHDNTIGAALGGGIFFGKGAFSTPLQHIYLEANETNKYGEFDQFEYTDRNVKGTIKGHVHVNVQEKIGNTLSSKCIQFKIPKQSSSAGGSDGTDALLANTVQSASKQIGKTTRDFFSNQVWTKDFEDTSNRKTKEFYANLASERSDSHSQKSNDSDSKKMDSISSTSLRQLNPNVNESATWPKMNPKLPSTSVSDEKKKMNVVKVSNAELQELFEEIQNLESLICEVINPNGTKVFKKYREGPQKKNSHGRLQQRHDTSGRGECIVEKNPNLQGINIQNAPLPVSIFNVHQPLLETKEQRAKCKEVKEIRDAHWSSILQGWGRNASVSPVDAKEVVQSQKVESNRVEYNRHELFPYGEIYEKSSTSPEKSCCDKATTRALVKQAFQMFRHVQWVRHLSSKKMNTEKSNIEELGKQSKIDVTSSQYAIYSLPLQEHTFGKNELFNDKLEDSPAFSQCMEKDSVKLHKY